MAASKPVSCKNLAAAVLEVTSDPQEHLEDGAGISTLQPMEIAAVFPLVWQSSIYSRTLDEIQNTVCVPGKNFGSMNMDEFLTNIWNVEDGFDASGPAVQAQYPVEGQPPLNRQGSLSLPSQLCRKTVDEVWAEIHREQQNIDRLKQNNGEATRKPTFGEMTLEDFLIKAGVVRKGNGLTACAMEANGAPGLGHLNDGGALGNVRRGDFYCKTGDAGGGLQLGMVGSPASPLSADGKGGCYGGVDSYGIGIDGFSEKGCGGRKRMMEGMVEKVVERRQRRMIKNRESAARSRARKQAYTVELETELNILKEQNARLREEERKAMQIRKQMLLEAMAKQTHHHMDKTSRSLQRSNSSPS
ncbi:protein ABSCISIC ACID-INSENSITIVE 5 isoform X1 [Dendrobium catenatum]|uniref:Protein ABSCISIC ACID-INSENSITIVE 5 n=1 Tax=Dendrobium catenatum TaxID=906689 RepID=A0A2I0XEJ7_9ASPA|nr:protein ABSCISIC ACID-INSENSITIVE 5 isoform X1 [Dendrobium catenatum]PKU86320.1 Protein ABSCISIC ACID-INSENSITIVE 5 [Dendrobium catenatum]